MKYKKQRQLDKNGYAKIYILEDKEEGEVKPGSYNGVWQKVKLNL